MCTRLSCLVDDVLQNPLGRQSKSTSISPFLLLDPSPSVRDPVAEAINVAPLPYYPLRVAPWTRGARVALVRPPRLGFPYKVSRGGFAGFKDKDAKNTREIIIFDVMFYK